MKSAIPQLNLVLAWAWILLGFISGMILGLNFHRGDWLGGYGSFPRRLYRLGHISFFGLGTVNLLFFFTVRSFANAGPAVHMAAWGFVLGAITMPICCFAAAHWPKCRMFFAVPVLSLIFGGSLLLWEITHQAVGCPTTTPLIR
ncbi:MAG: hypothetical protein HY735_02500 [Verrucomicrobia bacterium]|nr:hypothetical protein [Verrucomicrobiota bacterium]